MQRTKLMSIIVAALVVILVVLMPLAGAWAASKERVLYSFKNDGKDGMAPSAGLTFDTAGNLYGTTPGGGDHGGGTVFELTPGTSGKWTEKVLYRFKGGRDGYDPQAGVILDGAGDLYGTTERGGFNNGDAGTVFELTLGTKGKWTIKVLHTFGFGRGGINPFGDLIFDTAGNLYGTTAQGGGSRNCGDGCGTVFKLTPGATGHWTETVLHSFNGDKDGVLPHAGLILDAVGNLYGTTPYADSRNHGRVFELMPGSNGQWIETVLHGFDGRKDGTDPHTGLILDAAGNLYGTTPYGGRYDAGTVFELTPGSNGQWTETVLHNFSNKAGTDGAIPQASLILDAGGNLYGTTTAGGINGGGGTVFELTPGAKGKWTEKVLHTFGKGKDGAGPFAGLVFDNAGNLYGTTAGGGANGAGTVFELTP
jgi:uncharacterized repeat protein (TIGR03803 family)